MAITLSNSFFASHRRVVLSKPPEKRTIMLFIVFFYAGGGIRTPTPLRAGDFESPASASSATPARDIIIM